MSRSSSFRRWLPLLAQSVLVLVGLVGLYAVPPAQGRMVLVPLSAQGRATLAAVAIDHGARLVAAGPWTGSLLVDGRRDLLVGPLLRHGVIALSSAARGCGESGR